MCVALKRAGIFGAEMRMQTWRCTELLQMLEVTILAATQAVKRSLATSAFSSAIFSHMERNIEFKKNSRKRTVYLVCVINDVTKLATKCIFYWLIVV